MTKDSSAKRKAGKRKPEKLSFTQDFIPIKNLEHGIIETTDGRYIKILEIEPINFMLRSEEEQYEIICSFASWLKISPVHLQFKSITRKADSDKHTAAVLLCTEVQTGSTATIPEGPCFMCVPAIPNATRMSASMPARIFRSAVWPITSCVHCAAQRTIILTSFMNPVI